jgi:hypothetical protein
LRDACRDHGDLDWSDDLHLTDITEKIWSGILIECIQQLAKVQFAGKAGQVRYWQYGQAEKSPDLAISASRKVA